MEKLPEDITGPLLAWYRENKRLLPWREDKDPYHVWLSEIMLQQTRVEVVKGYYDRFLERLPEIRDLALVPDDELMKLWQGLGYYNRARNLKKAAGVIMEEFGGKFPEEYDDLIRLPGIGTYTAGAVASMAFGKAVPAADGNIYRIYTRLMRNAADITKGKNQHKIRDEIQRIMPKDTPGEFNQAWMDLGAAVCIPNGMPFCGECPLGKWCLAKKEGDMLQYPNKAPKKPRKIEDRTVFILEYQGKYILQKRPDTGLLAGLWEFPAREGHLAPEKVSELLEEWGIFGDEIELLGAGKHIFTHVEWHMLGYLVHLKNSPQTIEERMVLASGEQMEKEYSIPSAYRIYLKKLSERLQK